MLNTQHYIRALVVKLVDTTDLKSVPFLECQFESGRGHQTNIILFEHIIFLIVFFQFIQHNSNFLYLIAMRVFF